jgi:pilus assembly protein CpaF
MSADRALVARVSDRIWTECDPVAILSGAEAHVRDVVTALAAGFVAEELARPGAVDGRIDAEQVVAAVVDVILGLGPLQPLLADPAVSEIMVNGASSVFVERAGRIEQVDVAFDDDAHVLRVVERMLAPCGRRVDPVLAMVDARLPDGSRLNVVVPPLAVDGPALTIRRFVPVASTLAGLARLGSIEPELESRLRALVKERANVLVCGGTGSGKTTLLAAVLAACASDDRVVVVEDAAELRWTCRIASGWRRARPATRGRPRSASATCCATPCGCAPTGWSSARCAARRPST